jgi:primosomal protein N' (replication factor Y)
MIKFHMEFFDIIFPLKLGPLTYGCEESLANSIKTGMIVSAPLKNRIAEGIVIGKSPKKPDIKVKNIQKVFYDGSVLGSNMVNLIRWISEYYLVEQGLVLKNILPREAFEKVRKRDTKVPSRTALTPLGSQLVTTELDDETVSSFDSSIQKNTFRTFLLHAPSSLYEYSFLMNTLEKIRNAIILIPELYLINSLHPLLNERFGDRVCLFHSGLSRGKRAEALERIRSGLSDIVLGTRSAVFAPLQNVSFIAVLHEHSSSYKQESGLYYNGRDIAVKRGYFEKATVLLSSICPSMESLYNCKRGKYILMKPEFHMKKPKIKIIDMRYEKTVKTSLSKTVINSAIKYIKKNGKIIFVMNRRGYSTVLQCVDCNHIEECPMCRIPLVFHKHDMSMKCHYCGHLLSMVPEKCSVCNSYHLELFGAGTQRVQEDIEKFIGIKTLRIDSDRSKTKSDFKGIMTDLSKDDVRIIIGTKLMTKRLNLFEGFSMAAILNMDLSLNIPNFRSAEKAFQEISLITDKIEPQGEIFVQTRMPHNYIFKYLKDHDYNSFFREELNRRKSLNYPPYSRLIVIKCISKRDLSAQLSEIKRKITKDVEILGPSISKNSKEKQEFRLLLKSSHRESLHSEARKFIEEFRDVGDVKIKVDVDPISI